MRVTTRSGMTTLTWPQGDDADRIISIPINDDTAQEGNEQLAIVLSNFTGFATVDGNPEISVTVSANDAPAPPPGGRGGGGGRIDVLWLLVVFSALCLHARRRVAS